MPSKKHAIIQNGVASCAKPVSIANDVVPVCQLDAENSTSSAPLRVTNDAHPTPLPEGQLLHMIAEMKA